MNKKLDLVIPHIPRYKYFKILLLIKLTKITWSVFTFMWITHELGKDKYWQTSACSPLRKEFNVPAEMFGATEVLNFGWEYKLV